MARVKDLTGQKFNKLQVIKRVDNSKHNKARYLCKCDCGNETIVDASYLRNGRIKSCGCFKDTREVRKVNIGDTFGQLTVIKKYGKDKHGNILFLCKCTCGNETVATANNLRKGHTKSCGCLRQKSRHQSTFIHGMRGTRLYNIWKGMKQRCNDKNCRAYKWYGARGVKVCDEWDKEFTIFYKWAINNGYSSKLTIDRINVDGNYEPLNCRWVNTLIQNRNKRDNHYIEINGEVNILAEWCRLYNIHNSTFYRRIKMGYSEEEAIIGRRK